MKRLRKFHPNRSTTQEVVEWIKSGDIYEAEKLASLLAGTLYSLAENSEELSKILDPKFHGILFTPSDYLKLIADCLLEKAVNSPGMSRKSGAELFSKLLVPNKVTASQNNSRWIAATAWQFGARNEINSEKVAELINELIVKNNKIFQSFGETFSLEGYNPAIPSRLVTPSQVEKSLRKWKATIDRAENLGDG